MTTPELDVSFGIYLMELKIMVVAKVFMNGRSQAIRLPKDFRVDTDEVYLKKTRGGFLVIPKDPWETFYEGIKELSADFMSQGRVQPDLQQRDWDE